MEKNSGNDIMFELENERQINGKVYRKKNENSGLHSGHGIFFK